MEPRIDSEVTIPPTYVAWQAGTTNRIVVPTRQAWNRFLGSLEGLQIRALNHYPKEFLFIQALSPWKGNVLMRLIYILVKNKYCNKEND